MTINLRTLEAFLNREPVYVGAFVDGVRVDSITVLTEEEVPAAIEALQGYYPKHEVRVYRRLSDEAAPQQGDTQ
jgi:hypothetical protein